MEEDDKKIFKENIVDFILFLYYLLRFISVDLKVNILIEGNVFVSFKNLYLDVSEWGW